MPSRGRILVVEDNEVNQLLAREMVAKLGYRADVVADGAEAVSATAARSYAAVLMDCHMPVMDGFEATRAIRARGGDNPARLPIITMTSGPDEDRERCLTAGMDDYLSKPRRPGRPGRSPCAMGATDHAPRRRPSGGGPGAAGNPA